MSDKWICDICGTEFDEYINGCPHCENAGLRSGVRQPASPPAQPSGETRKRMMQSPMGGEIHEESPDCRGLCSPVAAEPPARVERQSAAKFWPNWIWEYDGERPEAISDAVKKLCWNFAEAYAAHNPVSVSAQNTQLTEWDFDIPKNNRFTPWPISTIRGDNVSKLAQGNERLELNVEAAAKEIAEFYAPTGVPKHYREQVIERRIAEVVSILQKHNSVSAEAKPPQCPKCGSDRWLARSVRGVIHFSCCNLPCEHKWEAAFFPPERVEPTRRGIYMASKTKHAQKWKDLRASGVPIISTWIDEAGIGETKSFEDLWQRCIAETGQAERVIVYAEPGDELKGALVEVGAALASGTPVYVVGNIEALKTARNHRLVHEVGSLEAALACVQEGRR